MVLDKKLLGGDMSLKQNTKQVLYKNVFSHSKGSDIYYNAPFV